MLKSLNATENKIGETLVLEGFMTEKSVDVVLLRQEYGDSRLFGQIATSLNFLSEDNLFEYLKN